MMKYNKLILPVAILMFLSSIMANGSMLIPINNNAKNNSQGPENSPVISATESGNWELERVDFIHYAKPDSNIRAPRADTCYKLLGVKWKTLPVSYIINPSNTQGLSQNFITAAISTSAKRWDLVTSTELYNNDYTVDYNAKYGVQNFKNEISFGDYKDNGVIAVTTIWFTRLGKQLVEFDMLFNTKYAWGDATVNISVMDLENIAIHELGHSIGLGDIYSTSCFTVTMFGYSDYGETLKRTLEEPDVIGLQKIYGV